jgi:hypothetical protein
MSVAMWIPDIAALALTDPEKDGLQNAPKLLTKVSKHAMRFTTKMGNSH